MSLQIAWTIEEALVAIDNGARPIAGGTDLVVGARSGKHALPDQLVAIDRLGELQRITSSDGTTTIGAGVNHSTLMTDPQISTNFSALADASALVGSPATRNVGTIGGNIMNASPAMDTGAPLIVLGAMVELANTNGTRRVPIQELWLGPGAVSAASNELCVAIALPHPAEHSGSAYVRLEYRRAMEIAVVGAAARVDLDEAGRATTIQLALSAVGPTITAVPSLTFDGRTIDSALLDEVADSAREFASPISDLRASDRYRAHCGGIMAKRAVQAAARRASGETLAIPVNRTLGIGATA